MNTLKRKAGIMLASAIMFAATSCKKDNSMQDAALQSLAQTAALADAGAIAVAATSGGDSLYAMNAHERNQRKDSIAFSSLPATASVYLTDNYAGYTAIKALRIKNSNGDVVAYVAIVKFNDKPVAIKFDATGSFVKVLEQREGKDCFKDKGFHHGGHFDDRDEMKRDTLALAALPAAITSYFATNYAQDTLVKAFTTKSGNIIVVSQNNGPFATVFGTNNSFVKRVQLPAKHGKAASVDLTALPTNSQSYLTTTYPNYVFKHAFKITVNNTLQGYVVIIDANETKYAVEFDASGGFVKAVTIR